MFSFYYHGIIVPFDLRKGVVEVKIDYKKFLMSIITVLIGNFILAFGVCAFILPLNVITGGVAGVAVVLHPILHISETMLINILTISLFIIGSIVLGKRFAFNTFLSSIVYPSFVNILNVYLKDVVITDNLLVASIYAGICTGIGVGIVCKYGSSTGGMDIPPLIINKYTKIPLSILVTIIDGLTVILGAMIYGVEASLIGLFSVLACGKTIDIIMKIGKRTSKSVLICSDQYDEVLQNLSEFSKLHKNILYSDSLSTNNQKQIIIATIETNKYKTLIDLIKKIDENARIISIDMNEVNEHKP